MTVLAALALVPATAEAGRLVATGHDADLHCAGSTPTSSSSQCHYVQVVIGYVRAGAPNPSKPVLVLDRGSLQMQKALDAAFGAGAVPMKVVDPRSDEFKSLPINVSSFSAIAVASDKTCGGCDLNESDSTPDSDAIIARKSDIEAFFNAGGGIFAAAGANHGNGNATDGADSYYSFLPLPVGGVAVSSPFTLTDVGKSLGLEDVSTGHNDINCCPTHNSFSLPASGGALKVAETDSKGFAETLIAEGSISGGTITPTGTPPPPTSITSVASLPSNKKCLSRRHFRIRLRHPRGYKIVGATVKVNGTTVATRRQGRRATSPVDLRNLPKGTYTVSIAVLLDSGDFVKGKRKYRTCTKKQRGRNRSPV
jgi:hypothetical protein